MTRFDAAAEVDRRDLFVDAITAHRERASPYLTIEVDEGHLADEAESASGESGSLDPELGTPWVQFAEDTCNLDCTDAELDRLKTLLESFPSFSIAETTRPDDAEGTNVRVSTRSDADRIAQFLDAVFQGVYELPKTYRAWVVEI